MPNKLLILLVLLPLSLQAEELKCTKGKIKKLLRGKETVETASYCTDKKGTILISEACHKQKCLEKLKGVEFDLARETASGVGSPGFALCRKLGGSPEIISFKLGKGWASLDRCLLEPASNYVDTGHLYKVIWEKTKQ